MTTAKPDHKQIASTASNKNLEKAYEELEREIFEIKTKLQKSLAGGSRI